MSQSFRDLIEKYCVSDYDPQTQTYTINNIPISEYLDTMDKISHLHEDPGDVQVPQVTHAWAPGDTLNVTWDNYNSSDPMWEYLDAVENLYPTAADVLRALDDAKRMVSKPVFSVAPLQLDPAVCVTKNTNPECDINWDYHIQEPKEVGFGDLPRPKAVHDPEPTYDHYVNIPIPGEGTHRVTFEGEVVPYKRSF